MTKRIIPSKVLKAELDSSAKELQTILDCMIKFNCHENCPTSQISNCQRQKDILDTRIKQLIKWLD